MELTQTNTSHSSVNRFRGDGSQTVVSLLAGVDHASVCAMTAPVPAARVARAVPLPPVKDHKGVTIYYARPGDADGDATGALVGRVFGALGTAVPCANETTMATLQVNTAMMGNYYALLQAMHGWTVANGVDADAASTFIGALMHSVAADGKAAGGGGFDALIAEQTPGGYNEMGIRELREAGVYDEVRGREETNRARVACVSRRFVSASDHKRGGAFFPIVEFKTTTQRHNDNAGVVDDDEVALTMDSIAARWAGRADHKRPRRTYVVADDAGEDAKPASK